MTSSTCAGYDDNAQICGEHGGEGGQNASLTAEVHETRMTGGGGWPQRLQLFIFCCALHSSSFIHFPFSIGFHFSRRQPDEGWRGMERAASRGL